MFALTHSAERSVFTRIKGQADCDGIYTWGQLLVDNWQTDLHKNSHFIHAHKIDLNYFHTAPIDSVSLVHLESNILLFASLLSPH